MLQEYLCRTHKVLPPQKLHILPGGWSVPLRWDSRLLQRILHESYLNWGSTVIIVSAWETLVPVVVHMNTIAGFNHHNSISPVVTTSDLSSQLDRGLVSAHLHGCLHR